MYCVRLIDHSMLKNVMRASSNIYTQTAFSKRSMSIKKNIPVYRTIGPSRSVKVDQKPAKRSTKAIKFLLKDYSLHYFNPIRIQLLNLFESTRMNNSTWLHISVDVNTSILFHISITIEINGSIIGCVVVEISNGIEMNKFSGAKELLFILVIWNLINAITKGNIPHNLRHSAMIFISETNFSL